MLYILNIYNAYVNYILIKLGGDKKSQTDLF